MSGRLPPIFHHAGAIARLRALAQHNKVKERGIVVLNGKARIAKIQRGAGREPEKQKLPESTEGRDVRKT